MGSSAGRTGTLATKSNEARSADPRSDATIKKDERAADGARAMAEYQVNGRLAREQMARLRALRLAREAEDERKPAAKPAKPAKPAPKATAAKKK
jgi:hypothetical protein